jgi:Fe-S-cluster containining protein
MVRPACGGLTTANEVDRMNWILIKAVIKARKAGLLHLKRCEGPLLFECLASKCAKCCLLLGSPVVTEKETEKIDRQYVLKNKYGMFIKSEGCTCCLLKENLCSIYPNRPRGCREYPWYNIDGRLYYDSGCPGITTEGGNNPDVKTIQPFENFFPRSSKFIIRLIKKICLRK